MLEVAAPAVLSGKTRWLAVGGVVKWDSGEWKLVSIQPREIDQPARAEAKATDLGKADQSRTLSGLGWQLFSNAKN